MPNDHLINEGDVPDNWEPVESNPIVPGAAPEGAPAFFNPNPMPQFFQGSLAPQLQHDTSFVGTEVGSPRIPKFSLMPFGDQQTAFTNAAIQSTASKTSGGGGSAAATGTITLDIPTIFVPVTQTANLPNAILDFGLATEPPRTVFAGQAIGAAIIDTGAGASALGLSVTVSATSTASADLGLLFVVSDEVHPLSAPTLPSGWTAFFNSGSNYYGARQNNIAPGTTSATTSYTTNNVNYQAISAFLLMLGVVTSTTPVITNRAAGGGSWSTLAVGGGAAVVASGESLIAVVQAGNLSQQAWGGFNSPTDNHGNTWVQVGNQTSAHTEYVPDTTYYGTAITVWVCTNPVAATNYTFNFSTVGGVVAGGTDATVFGITNLTSVAGIPVFRNLVQSDIPSINLADNGGGSGDFGGVYNNLDVTHLDSGTNAGDNTVFFGTSPDGEWKQPALLSEPGGTGGTSASYTTQAEDAGVMLEITANPTVGPFVLTLSNSFWGWITNQSPKTIKVQTLANIDVNGNLVPSILLARGQSLLIGSVGSTFIAMAGGTSGASPLPLSLELNGIGVSADKQLFFNGVSDGATVWTITINGTPDGG